MTTVPTVAEVADVLKEDVAAIESAYDAELVDQASRCRVEPYTAALASALVRRVGRSVEMQNLPLGVLSDELGSTRIGSTDPEVRRLESPYRRAVVG